MGLRILKKRVRELFTHREGISTPRAHHKRWQPLIECAKHDFKIMYFPFFIIIIIILNQQGCCPCSYVSPGAIRKSDLRSSLSLNVCGLNWFYVFVIFILIANKESLRRWTLKRSQVIFGKKKRNKKKKKLTGCCTGYKASKRNDAGNDP